MYLSYINANVKADLTDGNLLFHLKQPYELLYLQRGDNIYKNLYKDLMDWKSSASDSDVETGNSVKSLN